SLYNFYFKKILPGIGRITSKDNSAYTYLYESVQVFPEGENFVKILESTGYQKSKCRKLSFGICSLYTAFK
ncbi:MAG: class I SAM-dependent methyltransferase, partial [Saprospiraceae bacterium]|nr:class I SAM-dependent methyltransferase [Saprospiraceae bacterium]